MLKTLNRVGEKYITKENYKIEIIEYFGKYNCTIQFEDDTIIKCLQYNHIKTGNIKNPNHKSVCDVGYIGIGKYKARAQNKLTDYYTSWQNMLIRCYKDSQEKRLTYKDVLVCEEWHNFQNFAEWYEKNRKPYVDDKWHLDKDILLKGNKVYSPETCCFVPHEINTLFTKNNINRGDYPIGVSKIKSGRYRVLIRRNNKLTHLGTFDTPKEAFEVYKNDKEVHIKEVADKWRGQIIEQVYNAMYNYEVKITD